MAFQTFPAHQREVFAAIVTQYTDWRSADRHPATIRDKTMMALQDALFVSPLIETGDYHASLNQNSWFYVFDYQSKHSGYKQVRQVVQGTSGGPDEETFFVRTETGRCSRRSSEVRVWREPPKEIQSRGRIRAVENRDAPLEFLHLLGVLVPVQRYLLPLINAFFSFFCF